MFCFFVPPCIWLHLRNCQETMIAGQDKPNPLKEKLLIWRTKVKLWRVVKICAKAFKNNRALKFHMNSHTGERPYKCDKCGAAFLRPTNLANHVVIHRNEKFTCEVCARSFVHKRSFDRHKLLHTGDQSVSRISIVKQVLVVWLALCGRILNSAQ